MRSFLSMGINSLIAFIIGATSLRILFTFDPSGMPVRWADNSGFYLKYFTTLSNLLMGLASAVYGIELRLKLCYVKPCLSWPTLLLKYVATTSVALTFCVVLIYIGPKTAYQRAYTGGNLWLHLIVPLLAVIDYALLDDEGLLPFSATFAPLAPISLYGLVYLGNLMLHGYGGKGHPNDWYGFAANGPKEAYMIFVWLFFSAWGLALLLRFLHNEDWLSDTDTDLQ